MRVLFRVETGPRVGLGHLSRCLALASALEGHGVEPEFLVLEDAEVLARLARRGFAGAGVGGRSGSAEDLARTVEAVRAGGCAAVVVDSYEVDGRWLDRLRRLTGAVVCVIDDLARFPFSAQLVVNGGAAAGDLPYDACRDDVSFLLGPRYALLRPEFGQARPRTARERVETVLLALGSADSQGLAAGLLGSLLASRDDFEVALLAGPYFEAAALPDRVRLVPNPDSPVSAMLEADVAVSAAGQTLYELAALGVPTVAIRLFDNQAGNLAVLTRAGAVLDAGAAAEEGLAEGVVGALDRLAGAEARAALGARAREVVDGRGAGRVARALVAAMQAPRVRGAA